MPAAARGPATLQHDRAEFCSAPYKHTPLISRFLTDLLRFSGTMLKIVSFCDKIQ